MSDEDLEFKWKKEELAQKISDIDTYTKVCGYMHEMQPLELNALLSELLIIIIMDNSSLIKESKLLSLLLDDKFLEFRALVEFMDKRGAQIKKELKKANVL